MLLGNLAPSRGFSPLTDEHRERQMLFAMLWAYYRGRHRKHLKVRAGQPDDNVTLNYSKRMVNKSVQFLFGKATDFEIDETTKERTREEAYLDEVWGTDEEKHVLLQKVALNGAICGTAVVRLYEPDPDVPDSLPRIVNLDPALLDVVTHDDDCEDVQSYRITWKSGEVWKRHRIDKQMDDTWFVTVEIAKSGSSQWQEVGDESAPWPYPFAPIITCQNYPLPNEFWGMSDLEDADLNDAINFNASNSQRILKHHAHPKTIGTGMSAEQLQDAAVDEFWTVPAADAKVFNLEMQSDLSAAYNFLAMLKTSYSKVAGVPELDPAVVNVGALSGFALRILYGDLLEITYVKRNTYGALLNEVNKRVLHLAKLADYGTIEVENVWQDPLPSSGLEQAQTLQIDRANGLSMKTYLERRQYDPEREAERRKQEQKEQQARLAAAMTNAQRGFDQEDEEDDA